MSCETSPPPGTLDYNRKHSVVSQSAHSAAPARCVGTTKALMELTSVKVLASAMLTEVKVIIIYGTEAQWNC